MHLRIITICLFFCVFLTGCALNDSSYSAAEANRRLVEIVKKEVNYEIQVKTVGQTLWVYLPLKKELFTFKMTEQPPQKTREFSLLYLDGTFLDNTFHLEYDIAPSTKQKSADEGLSSAYTEAFNNAYASLFAAISGVYLNTQEPPTFVVLIIADIEKGIEVVNTFCLDDLKKQQTGALAPQEYVLRFLTSSQGDKAIINDKKGAHIDYNDIGWSEFLLKQMIHRINFKYTQSDFPPQKDAETEILDIVGKTTRFYDFKDFSSVELNDLRNSKNYAFSPSQLKTFER